MTGVRNGDGYDRFTTVHSVCMGNQAGRRDDHAGLLNDVSSSPELHMYKKKTYEDSDGKRNLTPELLEDHGYLQEEVGFRDFLRG